MLNIVFDIHLLYFRHCNNLSIACVCYNSHLISKSNSLRRTIDRSIASERVNERTNERQHARNTILLTTWKWPYKPENIEAMLTKLTTLLQI